MAGVLFCGRTAKLRIYQDSGYSTVCVLGVSMAAAEVAAHRTDSPVYMLS